MAASFSIFLEQDSECIDLIDRISLAVDHSVLDSVVKTITESCTCHLYLLEYYSELNNCKHIFSYFK